MHMFIKNDVILLILDTCVNLLLGRGGVGLDEICFFFQIQTGSEVLYTVKCTSSFRGRNMILFFSLLIHEVLCAVT